MRKLIIFLLFTIPFSVFAQNLWITQQASEFTTASGTFVEVGTKTRGYVLGTEQGSSGTSPYCFVMTDGLNWNACSPNLSGAMKFALPTRILPDGKMVGVLMEFQGFNTISSFFVSDDLANIMPNYFFDSKNDDDKTTGYGESLSVIGNKVWLGLKNGKIKYSEDLGINWENIVVSSNTDMMMTVVKMYDESNGYAAGGEIGEDTDYDGNTIETVLEKGSIYKTGDGGKTWTPVVENLEMLPLDIIETSSGRLILLFHDDETIADAAAGSKRVVWTDDNFASFTGTDKSFDLPIPSGTFFMSTVLDIDEGARDEIWASGFCGQGFSAAACVVTSTDGGQTWFENLVPGAKKLGPISVLDNDHVWIAGEFKAIYKWGDPNEDLTETEEPDDTETPDETVTTDDEVVDETQDSPDEAQEVTDEEINDNELPADEVGCSCSLVI